MSRIGIPSRVFGLLASLLALATISIVARGQDAPTPPTGFLPKSRPSQAAAEKRALTVPAPEKARSWLRTLTEEPHVAGTKADKDTAIFVRDKLRSWGWTADLAEYEVLLNYPRPESVLCEIVRPTKRPLKVTEDPNPADKDSTSTDAWPAFNGYGVSGDVTGQVVYANYGRPDDFAALEKAGVDAKGKIVLVRYGELFRGLKVLNAQKRGAIGVLIFSDPADDGYGKGDVYPSGSFRPPSAIQRGSVQFLSLGPGDPSTPGIPSLKGAKRLPIHGFHGFALDNAATLLNPLVPPQPRDLLDREAWEKASGLKREEYFATIPCLPISYESAKPILEELGGPNALTGWQGGLPLPYHLGPGPAEVRFRILMDYQVRTVWNVVATIKGSTEPDRWVMIGNHRDAWVYGAVDPGSGTAATMEMCRAIGDAVKNGWKPRRTLVYASWDAEEYGLVGSTEWAEEYAKEIDQKAVMMLNVDSAVAGADPDFDGVPSMRDLLLGAAADVFDHRSGRSIRDIWLAKQRAAWASSGPIDLDDSVWNDAQSSDATPVSTARGFTPQMNSLGSGSDYTAFVDHLGVPAVDVGFVGKYGVYHSIYDDFYWMEKFCDPEFVIHATAARLYALVAMRAAGADLLPLRFSPYADALRDHVNDLRRILERKARAADAGDPKRRASAFEGLPRLVKAIKEFRVEADRADRAVEALAAKDDVSTDRLARVNDALTRVERAFLIPAGLPKRPWFKHAIYAPGTTTGYASWPLPGIRQAVEDGDASLLAEQTATAAIRIEAAAAALRSVVREATDRDAVKIDREKADPLEIDPDR